MKIDKKLIENIIENQDYFSGVVCIDEKGENIFEGSYGYRNISEKLNNNIDTRFGIASGCKLFTSIAICQLVQKGKLSFDTYLMDCLNINFPKFNPNIKIHHLLTHSSGVPDYFDEEVMDDFADLWKERPMYNIETPKDFIPMFIDNEMDFEPGSRFKYNNTGFIILGLIIEEITGMKFTEYIEKNIFEPCGMTSSGYFKSNQLPSNTAYGHIRNDGNWETNVFSLPIIGGPDGGAFTTAKDISKLWEAIFSYEVLNKEITEELLKTQILDEDVFYYGYGIWIIKENDEISKYYIMGQDPGVSMMSTVYPKNDIKVTVIGNTDYGTWSIAKEIQNLIMPKGLSI